MTPDKEENVSKTLREQQVRAQLRESFLRALVDLNGRPCTVLNYEQVSVPGIFAGWVPDASEMLVRNLRTPSGYTIRSALLRYQDVIAFQFEGPL